MSETRDLSASYDPGPEFWSSFVRRSWGRRPTVIRQPFARPIASPAEVFSAIIAATERLHTDDFDFGLTIDDVRVGADVERWLPTKKDGSLERLAERIAAAVPGSSFAVFVRAFQRELGWEFWKRLRRFLGGLYALVGVPAHRAEVDLFAGTYPRTRRGIHLDSGDVFCFVTEGRKRIRVWPGSTFPEGGSYWYGLRGGQTHLSRSSCLDGEPGDILYWPSSYWHVGESRSGTVSSLSLALYTRDSLAATASGLIEGEAERELGAQNFIEFLPTSVDQLETPQRALRAFARVTSNLGVALLRRRMEQVSGYAFEHVPLPPPRGRFRASSTLAADPAFPIFCRSSGRTAIIAANGRSITLPRSKALRDLIDALNRGDRVSLTQPTGEVNPHLREALRFLLVSGAVETHRAAGAVAASRAR